jgi:hypothetical protein
MDIQRLKQRFEIIGNEPKLKDRKAIQVAPLTFQFEVKVEKKKSL